MKWEDIGGYTRVQHLVTASSYGNFVRVLCGARIGFEFSVKRSRPVPRCRGCLKALARLNAENAKLG